jgi:cyclomaltodextrinase / maltogenic alpha-amylase / neopullulanase
MTVPAWVEDAVFYHIFPDRFANGDASNDPPGVQPWGSPPTIWGFQGGDLRGVLDHLDYLSDLGVNALLFNPIFQASSNHRYNTYDYYRIDPKLGSEQDFRALLDAAHRREMKVVLDGVFNHCGRGFYAFHDLLENESHSPYADWFHVRHFPLHAYGHGDAENYLGWWKFKSLPKFKTGNPAVRRYLMGVARHWVEQGIDGWRLDVPNEINDDSFWAEFRDVVKSANPDAYLVGEIWDGDPRWVSPGHFDGLLNYPLRDLVLAFVAGRRIAPSDFGRGVQDLMGRYSPESARVHYLPLGSHDTERLRTVCGGDVRRVKLAFLLQFFHPGAPGIYYGDEIGMEGGKDPDSRRAFPWDRAHWDNGLRQTVQELARMRHARTVLRRGDLRLLDANDASGTVAFGRTHGAERALLLVNASDQRVTMRLAAPVAGLQEGQELQEALGGGSSRVAGGFLQIELPEFSGQILFSKPTD